MVLKIASFSYLKKLTDYIHNWILHLKLYSFLKNKSSNNSKVKYIFYLIILYFFRIQNAFIDWMNLVQFNSSKSCFYLYSFFSIPIYVFPFCISILHSHFSSLRISFHIPNSHLTFSFLYFNLLLSIFCFLLSHLHFSFPFSICQIIIFKFKFKFPFSIC